MVALYIFLGAQDQGDGTVHYIFTEEQHIFLFVALRASGALLKVNSAPEQLGAAVLQHSVCVHIAYGAAPGLQGVIVKVKGAIPGAQVADVCRKAAVVSVQVGLAPGVGGFAAQKQLHQLKVCTGTAVGANVVDHCAVRAR